MLKVPGETTSTLAVAKLMLESDCVIKTPSTSAGWRARSRR
jgi:hypothetical protein